MEPSVTRYAKSGDVNIAYQVTGSGPIDLVWVPGFISNLELDIEYPEVQHFIGRLTSFCRLIRFDKRGTGISDRAFGVPSLEQRMDDVRAVMDAVASQRAALFGQSEGGSMSALFAATYPDRTQALVLYGAFAINATRRWSAEQVQARVEETERRWGTAARLPTLAPSKASDPGFVRTHARYERLSASPATAAAFIRMNHEIDVLDVLPAVRVPTLVLHRRGDQQVKVEAGRELAAHISGAKFVELPGNDHLPYFGDSDSIVDEVEEFLTGSRHEIEPDRVLATVMFTDIVDSTKRAAELGDRKWRALLDRHDQAVREQLARFRGREVKNLGDGVLATFDGPARAVRCATAIGDAVREFGIELRPPHRRG